MNISQLARLTQGSANELEIEKHLLRPASPLRNRQPLVG